MTILIACTTVAIGYCIIPQKHEHIVPSNYVTIFSASLTPSKIEWLDSHTLAAAQGNKIILFDTETRHSKVRCSYAHTIIDFSLRENGDFAVITKFSEILDIHICDSKGISGAIASIPLEHNFSAKLGAEHLCLTKINTITEPSEIATTIEMTTLDDPLKKITFSTSLTIEPVSCDLPLILTQPFPLEPKAFIWKIGDQSPRVLPYVNNSSSTMTSFHFQNGILGIQAGNSIFLLSPTFSHQQPINFSHPEGSIWGIVNQSKMVFIDNPAQNLTVLTEHHSASYNLPNSNQLFISILPTSDGTSFALTSADGKLWIARISEVNVEPN